MTKILLVEDDKSLREIYGVRLLAEGYDIVSAGDGEEALAMAIKEKPKLIISDVMMPKISGFDMLDILRSTTETRDIKVIMMTALSSDDQRNRGEQLGADKYLVKSQVGIEDVVRTVHEVLEDATAQVATTAPAAATLAPADPAAASEPAAAPASDDVTTASEPADSPVAAAAAPGNDGAGPLPPQPAINDSSLPQPTAPFTSPRPANLGERVIQPLAQPDESSNVTAEEIARELQASADPVNSQVDEVISDADVADNTIPANEQVPAPSATTDFSAAPSVSPVAPETTPQITQFGTPESAPSVPEAPAATPVTPTDPFAAPVAPEQPEETPAAPSTNPSVPPVQPQQ